MTTPYRIDFHRHVIPDIYLKAMNQAGVRDPLHGVAHPRWDVDTDLGLMDRYGIRAAMVSITFPGVNFADGREAARLARACNDALAQLIADHPTRYGAFALIPLPQVNAALREIDYALDVLAWTAWDCSPTTAEPTSAILGSIGFSRRSPSATR
jgi:6-methylsalicylate decarboxylase